ncbi:GNAT family N-acetyltransferase [uncultured Erythrobacter sp.]|uniref:GNAT family N-acetyltransferase n=1 Tax=uncultured Erythrobacter sp. TaxID=263913 RepID=UPI00261745DA|nr:GNAT family N-acetyltransferase [uncultured Erythrobacter sp.]
MFHRSERLLLRPVWPEDWQAVYGGIADEDVVRNLARAPWPYSPQDARDFVARTADPKFPKFLITLARSAQVVGCIGIDATEEHATAVELGYWVARSHWGQGIATEAGRAAIEVARVLGHRQVTASHFLDNPASGRVLEKIGFSPTGRIVARHSCGRGEEAMTVEYALDLNSVERCETVMLQVAHSQVSAA